MSDDPVKECEVCGEPVKRLLFPVAIHFKGSGFYSTDYARKNALGSPGTGAVNGGQADSSSADGGKESTESAKPSASGASSAEPAVATPQKD
jgi:predicted nucleic acid-binding Zn ribbon protein